MIGHGRPVVAAGAGRTGVDFLAQLFVKDVIPVSGSSGFRIEFRPDILEDGFGVTEISAGFPIELPQNAVLADGEYHTLSAGIDENTLEDDVQVQCFTRSMLEVPRHFSSVRIDGDGR